MMPVKAKEVEKEVEVKKKEKENPNVINNTGNVKFTEA